MIDQIIVHLLPKHFYIVLKGSHNFGQNIFYDGVKPISLYQEVAYCESFTPSQL